jgi:hypothetical protein
VVGLPDGYGPLWKCDEPGKSCNAHDPCAINPICSKQGLCVPGGLQSCDDGLPCTKDICKGMGLCDNVPQDGSCSLAVKVGGGADAGVATTEIRCFEKGDQHPDDPCLICDPEAEARKWTPANGGACDDGNNCTKDDYCQQGQCKGVHYGEKCSDQFGCTEDLCDGKGGCVGNQLKPDWCLINGACYKDGTNHPGGSCFTCDVKTSQSAWTPISDTCLINSKCYKQGDKHPSGDCAECDPQKSTSAWTLAAGATCLIGDKCYKQGDKDSVQCSQCDPATSRTAWTPIPGLCTIDDKCYQQGDKHTGGCAECDPAASANSWTVKGQACLVSNVCKKPQDQDPTGCFECDPAKDLYGWSPVANTCSIGGKCYKQGDKHTGGCAECDPAVNPVGWTVKVTTDCLIGGLCHKSGAANTGGCATCDPAKDKYGWTPQSGKCLIAGTCYSNGDKNTQATCAECDAATNAFAWTVKGTTHCFISGGCVTSGTADPGGCATCDPAKDKQAWTPQSGKCLIAGACYGAGDKDKTGCLQCDTAADPSAWSPVGGAKVTTHDFEGGAASGWTIVNSTPTVGWVVSTRRANGGGYALYYGNPVTGNYSSGAANNGYATMPAVSLAAGKKAGLSFMLYMDTESGTYYDKLRVYVGSNVVWEKNVTSTVTMKKWTPVTIDLSSYAGQTIGIKFDFATVDSVANSTEGVFVDDIFVYDNC